MNIPWGICYRYKKKSLYRFWKSTNFHAHSITMKQKRNLIIRIEKIEKGAINNVPCFIDLSRFSTKSVGWFLGRFISSCSQTQRQTLRNRDPRYRTWNGSVMIQFTIPQRGRFYKLYVPCACFCRPQYIFLRLMTLNLI